MDTVPPQRVVDRVLARIVEDANGCWIWPGARFGPGYGHISWHQDGVAIHRSTHKVMYLATVGPIPHGFDLDHLCRVRVCCNPGHLEAVTRQENLLRGQTTAATRAAQTHCLQGHEFTDANTRLDKLGRRICKECSRARNRAIDPAKKRQYNSRVAPEQRARYNANRRARRSAKGLSSK